MAHQINQDSAIKRKLTSLLMAGRIKKETPLRRHFITEWREASGLSRAALARAIGSSKPTITAIEKGGPYTQHSLEKIADALGVHPAWLILAPPDRLDEEIIRTLRATARQTLRFSEPRSRRRGA